MKLRDSYCVFALPQCHYNLYRHSFVLIEICLFLLIERMFGDIVFFGFDISAHAMLCPSTC